MLLLGSLVLLYPINLYADSTDINNKFNLKEKGTDIKNRQDSD